MKPLPPRVTKPPTLKVTMKPLPLRVTKPHPPKATLKPPDLFTLAVLNNLKIY
jgi:hypothetical protein